KLKKDQFAEFRVLQKGIDVVITTFNSKGEKIEVFDSTSSFGEELATISSNDAGIYSLEIQPFNKNEASGKYTLELKKVSRKAQTQSEMVDQYLARWNSLEAPGLEVAVVKEGKIIHNKGYGLADLEHKIPINSNSVFAVASISKQFTAFSILLLADEGKLSIDNDVRKYIPELADFGNTITLRHLLNHTSGLREQGVLFEMAGWRYDDITTNEQNLKLVSRQKELNFKPGTKFEYSNTGYSLLAEVVKRVSGKSFGEFTKQRIFDPLGMDNSSFPDDYRDVIPNRVASYNVSSEGYVRSILNSTVVGSSGLVTTAEDLSKWATNFEDPKAGNAKIIEQMKIQGILNSGEKTNYAMGQVVQPYKGLETFGHGGTTAGFKTFLLRIPSQKLSVIVFANSPSINPLNAAYEIADFYLTDTDKTEVKNIEIDDAILRSYAGDFEILNGIRYTVTKDGNKLFLHIMGGQKLLLEPLSKNEFTFQGEGRKLRFEADKGGKVNRITLNEGIYGGSTLDGERISIPAFDKEKVVLSEYEGIYYSDELDTKYEISVNNGQLIAKNLRTDDISLVPYDSDIFTGNTGFFLKAKFVRNKNSEIIGCLVSGTQIDNIRFEKVK
ncbi:MAG: serine hydrolase, partial [Acidobacteria bacterium]|nr:serine hydrolase [Acidobacteriota bacterium]